VPPQQFCLLPNFVGAPPPTPWRRERANICPQFRDMGDPKIGRILGGSKRAKIARRPHTFFTSGNSPHDVFYVCQISLVGNFSFRRYRGKNPFLDLVLSRLLALHTGLASVREIRNISVPIGTKGLAFAIHKGARAGYLRI